MALPSGQRTTVAGIVLHTQNLQEAVASQSVVLTTSEHIDLGRGDMLVSSEDASHHFHTNRGESYMAFFDSASQGC